MKKLHYGWGGRLRMSFNNKSRVAPMLVLLALPLTGLAQLTVESNIGTNNSSWSVAGNWSPANIPDASTEMAVLTNGTAETPITVRLAPNSWANIGGFWQGANNTLTRTDGNNAGLTFSASDIVSTVFTNEGTFVSGSASITSGTFYFSFVTNMTFRNSGTFLSTSGTLFVVQRSANGVIFTLDNSGGTMVADGGTLSLGYGAYIVGGSVSASNGGALWLSRCTLSNSSVNVAAGATLKKVDSDGVLFTGTTITNNGTVRVGGSSSGNQNAIWVTNAVMVNAGTTTVYVGDNGWAGFDYLKVGEGGTFHNTGLLIVTNERAVQSGGTGAGGATIDLHNELVNDGTILLTGPNGFSSNGVTWATGYTQLRPTGGGSVWLTGTGTVYITPQNYISNTVPVDGIAAVGVGGGNAIFNIGTNQAIVVRGSGPTRIAGYPGPGALAVNNYGTIVNDGSLGGPLNITPVGGYFSNYGSLIATNGACLNILDPYNNYLYFTNAGALLVQSGCILTNTMVFEQSAGTTRVDGMMISTSRVFNIAGGRLTGTGVVQGTVSIQNGATLAPGNPTGTLLVTNGATTITNGTLAIKLYDASTFSKLSAAGTGAGLNLKGTNDVLDVSLVNSYRWSSATTFRIFEGGTVSGTFDVLRWAGGTNNNKYAVSYGANYIDIVVQQGPGTIIVLL